MLESTFSILEPFVYLTEERNKRSLDKVLVQTLSELIEFESIIFLRVPNGAESEYMVPVISTPEYAYKDNLTLIEGMFNEQRVKADDWMNDSINFCKPIKTEWNGSTRAIFPIITDKTIAGILDIYGYDDDGHSDAIIIALTRIYGNFMAVIHDSEHDTLTGLLNRKTLDARLSELLSDLETTPSDEVIENERRSINPSLELWIGMLDIDHFKNINDNYGHLYGDEVLLLFSNIIQATFRSSDLMFRYGGEEFVVVLMNTTEHHALAVFDKFRKNIEDFSFPQIGKVSVSIGMTKLDNNIHKSTILEQADKALYYAKEHGRNQVCSYHRLISDGSLEEKKPNNDIDLF